MRSLAVGDEVFFEGMRCRVAKIKGPELQFDSILQYNGKPRFQTLANVADMRWSDEFNAWYLWGRLLGKARGGLGEDERGVVIQLRDHGVIPARPNRRPGQYPAGGEHINLQCLFTGEVDWKAELAKVRRGQEISNAAKALVQEYQTRFRKKLVDGYASPGADDSTGE